jgi:mono/diheme cytochrome c family protein
LKLAALAMPACLAAALAACSGGARDAGVVYQVNCARCHGRDGKGDSRSIVLYPALDLTASRMVRAGARGRGAIYQRIADGYGAMPGFSDRLETGEMLDLVDYVLRLPQGKAGR